MTRLGVASPVADSCRGFPHSIFENFMEIGLGKIVIGGRRSREKTLHKRDFSDKPDIDGRREKL